MQTFSRVSITAAILVFVFLFLPLSEAGAGSPMEGREFLDTAEVHVHVANNDADVEGATVKLDLNADGVWDPGDDEPMGVTDADGLVVFSDILSIEEPHGVNDSAVADDWSPARLQTGNLRGTIGANSVQVDFVTPADAGAVSLSIFDVRGRRLAHAHGVGDLNLEMPCTAPAGVYFLRLSAGSAAPVAHRFTSVGVRTHTVTAHRATPAEAVAAGWLAAPGAGHSAKDQNDAHQINLIVEYPDFDPVVQPEILVAGLNEFTVDLAGGDHDAAVVVLDADLPTARESAAFAMLVGMNRSPAYVAAEDVQGEVLEELGLIVTTEENALSAASIDEAIAAGCRVLLFYDAGAVLGGEWSTGSVYGYRDLIVESDAIFLDGYESNLPMTIQESGYGFRVSGSYPEGWTVVGRNSSNADYKTVLYREHASGGKGLIYSYEPGTFTGIGKNIADMIYRWFEGTAAFPGATVPEGHVAFVITGYEDGDTPDLTPQETAHADQLLLQGLDVTFIRFSRLADSDLSAASLVTGVHYPSLDRHSIDTALGGGPAVLMVYDAAACLGGDWGRGTFSGYRDLLVEANMDYLAGYFIDQTLTVQSTGAAYRIASSYPTGWSILGRNTTNSSYRTAFSHTSGASRGAIFTYDPSAYSDDGLSVAADIVTWLRE